MGASSLFQFRSLWTKRLWRLLFVSACLVYLMRETLQHRDLEHELTSEIPSEQRVQESLKDPRFLLQNGESGKQPVKTLDFAGSIAALQEAVPVRPSVIASSKTSSMPNASASKQAFGDAAPTIPDTEHIGNEYLAVCISIKNQVGDLHEWLIHHYHHHNISRFYIMDDGSSPPLSSYPLPPTIPRSALTFVYFGAADRERYMQLHIYDVCMKRFGARHTWIGFFDADEFLEVKGEHTLEGILRGLENDDSIGAFAINWQVHTSSGLLTRPESARKAFTSCISDPSPNHGPEWGDDNEHVKSFVKPRFYESPANPHKFHLKQPAQTVGEHGDVVDRWAWRLPPTKEKIVLHHYIIKSRQEYEEKLSRSNGMDDKRDWALWDRLEGLPSWECKEMTVYNP